MLFIYTHNKNENNITLGTVHTTLLHVRAVCASQLTTEFQLNSFSQFFSGMRLFRADDRFKTFSKKL